MSNILEIIKPLCFHLEPVGSRVTCNPAPTDTDEDYLVFVDDDGREALDRALTDADVEHANIATDTDYADESGYERKSWRFGDINLIVTSNPCFFNCFMAATELAKRFNLLDKKDRVDLFEAMRGSYVKIVPETYDEFEF